MSDKSLHSESITRSEHLSKLDGENIDAKRIAGYIWNGSEWERDSGSPSQTTRIDDTTTTDVVYIGKAAIGTATSAASWQIVKLDVASGMIKTWADGNASFDNVWDSRSSLTYV
jgi:hypothetical protein